MYTRFFSRLSLYWHTTLKTKRRKSLCEQFSRGGKRKIIDSSLRNLATFSIQKQGKIQKRHVSRFYFVCNHVSYPFCGVPGVRSPVAWDHARLKSRFLVAEQIGRFLKRWKREREREERSFKSSFWIFRKLAGFL